MKLILLHGWSQNKEVWNTIISKISNYKTLAIDLPGFGEEKIVDPNWGVPEYTDWVINKIKNYKQVILIGHSFGGRIATEIASKRPKWLRGIILSGSPSIYRPSFKTKLKIATFKVAKFLIPYNLRSRYFPVDLRWTINKGLEVTFRKVVSYDQTDQLDSISLPTLIIWGRNDKIVPLSIANEMHSLIKNSELKIINDAGHNSFLDNQNLFYSYVKKFIENIK